MREIVEAAVSVLSPVEKDRVVQAVVPQSGAAQMSEADRNGEPAELPAQLNDSAGERTHSQPHRRRMKQPPEHMIQAYRLSILMSVTQAELAELLQGELRRRVTQPEVSRWIKRVKEWLEAGNVLPDMSGERTGKADSVDPAVIEMGRRRDGRSSRQRPKADPDAARRGG